MTPGTGTGIRAAARCTMVDDDGASAHHHRIRHEVFVIEQAVFAGDDIDEHDGDGATIKVLGFWPGAELSGDEIPAGTVRLFPTSPDGSQWQGDRLAVLAPFRRHRIGAPLVEFAVRTAAQRGGQMMTAHIQLPNVAFFEAIGWTRAGAIETYVGIPHQPMAVDCHRRSANRENRR